MQLANALEQPLVFDLAARAPAGLALVIGGRRHAQNATDRLDPQAGTVLVDVAGHFGRSGSSSRRKTGSRTSSSHSRAATRSSPCAAAGSPRAPDWTTTRDACRYQPRPGAPSC